MANAGTEFAAYKAAVIADGGTLTSDSVTKQFIADLIDCNLWPDVKLAVIGAGGIKAMGASGAKVYGVGPAGSVFASDTSNPGAGFTDISTGFYAKPAITFAVIGANLGWDAVPMTAGDRLSIMLLGPSTNTGYTHGVRAIMLDGTNKWVFQNGGALAVAFMPEDTEVDRALMPSEFNTAAYAPFVASWHGELHSKRILNTLDGNTRNGTYTMGSSETVTEKLTKIYHDFSLPDDDTTVSVTLDGSDVDQAVCEFVMLAGDHSWDDAMAFAALRKARYSA